jgi:hypothetical protein
MHTSLSHFIDVSACFRHYPIFRRLYTKAELATIVCSCTRDQPTSTTVHNSYQFCVCVVPPEDGQVMPETCRDTEHYVVP